MVDRIQKVLNRLNAKELEIAELVLRDVKAKKFARYELKKLAGYSNVYRIRKGKMRIIFQIDPNENVILLSVARRDENTYKKF